MLAAVFAFALLLGVCRGAPTVSSADSRIVNGTATTVEVHPSIVQIDGYSPFTGLWSQSCGGTILSNNIVLTAAHCFHSKYDPFYRPEWRRIRAGATFRNRGGVVVEIASILNHPRFDIATFMDSDISILRLRTILSFGNSINSIRIIPQNYVIPDNSRAIHAGWGRIYTGGPSSDVLLQVTVNTINHDLCRQRYGGNSINNNMICAGVLGVFGYDACQGDSGGPLYYGGVLAGVVSWGGDCADPYLPGVSARVAAFTNWILANSN